MSDADELPLGWTEIKLGDLGIGRSKPCEPRKQPTTVFELWSVPSYGTGKPEVKAGSEIESGKQYVQPGDVLLCKINPRLNRVWLVGPTGEHPQVASTEWIVIRTKICDSAYLAFQLREESFRRELMETVAGVGGSLMRARPEEVKNIVIALPPFAEQRRIVARIKALQARSRIAREALDIVPGLLEQLRKSMLAAAFRGDLTADWREQHPDAEPAEALLDRIRQDRRRQWEAKNPRKKYVEPERVDDADLPDLPEGWAYARADEIVAPGTVISYGIVLPGDPLKEGVPYIRGQDIEDGRILVDQLWRTSPDIAAKHERSSLSEGDVLLCIIRHLKVAIVPKGIDGANLTQGTVRLRPSDAITGPYLAAYLESPAAQGWMKERYFGMAMPRINVEDARAIPVPVAPIEEQQEITRRIARHEQYRVRVVAEVKAALAEAARLDQSVLAKAFRGELVDQDPADEPATVLLERIRSSMGTSRRANQHTRR